MSKLYMVIDVESIGLHGEGFAVAWVIVDAHGQTYGEGLLCCATEQARGQEANRLWVAENVPLLTPTHPTPRMVRDAFWQEWLQCKALGGELVADCAWPVEANFLRQCVNDDLPAREWQGPYPLHDLATLMLAKGQDPLATRERLPRELPAHHPLHDARQSARQWVELLATP